MREAAATLRLKAKADFVVDADGNDRSGGVGRDDYLQPIRERSAFNRDFQIIHLDYGFQLRLPSRARIPRGER